VVCCILTTCLSNVFYAILDIVRHFLVYLSTSMSMSGSSSNSIMAASFHIPYHSLFTDLTIQRYIVHLFTASLSESGISKCACVPVEKLFLDSRFSFV
jgi:hypothetical protein